MKLSQKTSLRLTAFSGLLPLIYILSRITQINHPAEPSLLLQIISVALLILTEGVLICSIVGGIFLTEESKSFAAFFFTALSFFIFLIGLVYLSIFFGAAEPLSAAFGFADLAGGAFAVTALPYVVYLFSCIRKEQRGMRILSAVYGIFGTAGLLQFFLMAATGDGMDVEGVTYPAYYSLLTMDALAVLCIIPAVIGIILLILIWRETGLENH